jgi:FAD/FMN-containing dehydrogenase
MQLSRITEGIKLFKYDLSFQTLEDMDALVNIIRDNLIAKGHRVKMSGLSATEHALDDIKSSKVSPIVSGYELVLCSFGHAGDLNLHFNVLMRDASGATVDRIDKLDMIADVQRYLDECVFSCIRHQNGSISAEHGIGQSKISVLPLVRSPNEMNLMCSLKRMMDPNDIMNPGKVVISSQEIIR